MTEIAVDTREPEVVVRVLMTHDRAIDDFLADCRARGWSERSIRSYSDTLYRFTDRLPVDIDISKTTVDDLRRYRATRQRQIATNTLAGEEAHLASYFGWLYTNRLISRDPMGQLTRTKRIPAEDLDVTTVDTTEVQRLLLAAMPGAELNAVAITAYLGPRRHAVASLRLADYDRPRQLLRFREKGAKTIWKPVPAELADILDGSISRGDLREAPEDYLVPPEGYLTRPGVRDDRVVWRLIKKVADRAGIDCHVHALRAAFAVFYLERNPDDLLGLKDLLGHKSLNTTLIYLRRRNRQAGMERVRSLSWLSQNPPTSLEASGVVGAGGFEPPFPDKPHPDGECSQHLADALLEGVRGAGESAAERSVH